MKLLIFILLLSFQSCLESTPEKRQFPAKPLAPALQTLEGHFSSGIIRTEADAKDNKVNLTSDGKDFVDPYCFDRDVNDYAEENNINWRDLDREMVNHLFIIDNKARFGTTMRFFHEGKEVAVKCHDGKTIGEIKKVENIYEIYFTVDESSYHAYSLYYEKEKLVLEDIRANLEDETSLGSELHD